MFRLLLLLVVAAAVGGYFTKPTEAQMRDAADAVLSDPANIGEMVEGGAASLLGDRAFSDYYVGAKYDVTLNNEPVVECWGAFTQVKCNRVEGGDTVNNG